MKEFVEAVQLNDVECANDPESEPYKSKYKARTIWHDLKSQLEEILSDNRDNPSVAGILGLLALKLGSNYAACEELSAGEEHLERSVKVLEPHQMDPRVCNILQQAYNELGILWTGRRQPQKALEILQKGENLYKKYKEEIGNSPWVADELFQLKTQDEDAGEAVQKRSETFESTYTHTLYYIAQVSVQLEDSQKSAIYCHETLHRQLDTGRYDSVEWALNAATLSQYYMTQSNYTMARHCLASACQITKETGEPGNSLAVTPRDDESQEELSKRQFMPKTWADIYRCFTKYGLSLLEYSRDRLMLEVAENSGAAEADIDHNADKKPTNSVAGVTGPEETQEGSLLKTECEGKDNAQLLFNLELTSIENEITDQPLLVFDDARKVFLAVQKWINSSKEFYVLDGFSTDYVEIIQDHSKLYKMLAFFEPDFDRQCRMHKRRVDMLEATLKELSMQYYLMICRQLMYEIAETYSTMLDIKLAQTEESRSPPTEHAIKKINLLTKQSIDFYQKYVDSLKGQDGRLPEKYSEEDERPALIAHFCMGRLYSKFVEFEVPKRLALMKKSVDCYKHLVDYCRQHPDASQKVKAEVEICEEMVKLLPAKMDRIRLQEEY